MGIARLFTQTASVEPFLGTGTAGPRYGTAVTRNCFIDDARKLVRANSGEQVVSMTTILDAVDAVDLYPPQSRVTVNGRIAFVISINLRASAGPLSAHHVQVNLT